MHVIERTDAFTLVGADARRGKLTLFAAEGPRDPGALERVVLRVSDLDAALAAAAGRSRRSTVRGDGRATFEAPEGLGLGLVAATGTDLDYDIDHVVLRVPDPARSAAKASRRSVSIPRQTTGSRWATSACVSSAGRRAETRAARC